MIKYSNFDILYLLAAYACLCTPCFTAQLTDRQGDHFLTCCLNPCVLSGIRTKVRTAYKIEVNIYTYISYCTAIFSSREVYYKISV
jgi:hypothetical protein